MHQRRDKWEGRCGVITTFINVPNEKKKRDLNVSSSFPLLPIKEIKVTHRVGILYILQDEIARRISESIRYRGKNFFLILEKSHPKEIL